MKLALNAESARALRELAGAIPKAVSNILEDTTKLVTAYQSVAGRLGVHRSAFYEMLLNIKRAQEISSEALEILPAKLLETAEQIEAYLSHSSPAAPTGGSGGQSAPSETEPSSAAMQNAVISSAMTACGVADKADFGKLDSRTAKDICVAVAETKQMFPELNICFVGSAQSRNKAIEADLRTEYLSAYKRHYPDASEAELMPLIDEQIAEDMSCLQIGHRTIAQSLYVPSASSITENVLAGYNGISINEAYGSSYEYFKQVRQASVEKPVNCGTPKATVDHELGHQIAELVNAHNDPEIKELFERFSQLPPQDQARSLSRYAATSIHEFIAESWSEYRNNPQCRDCAKFVAARMIDLYEAREPVKKKVLVRRG